MSQMVTSSFQKAIDVVEALPPEDQETLIDLIHRRLIARKRAELTEDIAAAREAYRRGDVRRGMVDDLMAELAEPVTVTQRTNTIVGCDLEQIVAKALGILNGGGKAGRVPELWDGQAATHIVSALI